MLGFATVGGLAFGIYYAVDAALMSEVLPSSESRARDLGILNMANTGGQVLAPAASSLLWSGSASASCRCSSARWSPARSARPACRRSGPCADERVSSPRSGSVDRPSDLRIPGVQSDPPFCGSSSNTLIEGVGEVSWASSQSALDALAALWIWTSCLQWRCWSSLG